MVTGGRVKIGFHICLILLRNGCEVHATSRFPKDTADRYSQESDFNEWKDRLFIYGIDFRDIVSVNNFCDFLN